MSNALAIATVTATLQSLLQQAINSAPVGAVAGAEVKPARPSAPAAGALAKGVSIYLLDVVPNAALRNADLPTRDASGQITQRPRLALDLHYLLSFHGDEAALEPQRLLGIVASALHARPVLTRQAIRETVADPGFSALLEGSDLAEAFELVRFTPMTLNLEELSKIWSIFLQTPHILSVAYRAGVVLIEEDVTPRVALPVRERRIHVTAGPLDDAPAGGGPGVSPTIEVV